VKTMPSVSNSVVPNPLDTDVWSTWSDVPLLVFTGAQAKRRYARRNGKATLLP
jgi:hypothetical protein